MRKYRLPDNRQDGISPREPTENILNTCVGEREQSGVVDKPVRLRKEGTFD